MIDDYLAADIRRTIQAHPAQHQQQLIDGAAAIAANDKCACNALFLSNLALVVQLVSRKIAARRLSFHDGQDILQEIVVIALEKTHLYDCKRGRPGTFYGTIVWRTFSELNKRLCRQIQRFPQFAEAIDEDGNLPVDVIDYREQEPVIHDDLLQAYERIKQMPATYRTVVEQRLLGHTLADIGRSIGLTRERVRQIEAKALSFLRGEGEIRAPGKRGKSKRKSQEKKKGRTGREDRSCPHSMALLKRGTSDDLSFGDSQSVVNATEAWSA